MIDAGFETAKHLYSGWDVVAEYEGSWSSSGLRRRMVHGADIDEYVALRTLTGSEQKYYYHADTLGSIRALTNASGAVVETYDYDEYGRGTSTSAIGNTYFYTGRQLDTESALYYYRHRMYSPSHMRFLSRDPIGYAGGMNLYGYVAGNPVLFRDPFGLIDDDWSFIIPRSLRPPPMPVLPVATPQPKPHVPFVHPGNPYKGYGTAQYGWEFGRRPWIPEEIASAVPVGYEVFQVFDRWVFQPIDSMTLSYLDFRVFGPIWAWLGIPRGSPKWAGGKWSWKDIKEFWNAFAKGRWWAKWQKGKIVWLFR